MAASDHSRLSRVLWFVGLWLAGVAVVGIVSLLIRAVLMWRA
jgi:hypothetical protein